MHLGRGNPSPLSTKLDQARRRLVLARGLDGSLVGAWIGLGGVVVIVTIAIWIGWAFPIWSFALLPVGAVIGSGVALRDRPTRLDAAVMLDRLHGLHELLSSAWMLEASGVDAWSMQLRRMADERAAAIALPGVHGRFAPRLHVATWLLAIGVVAGAWLLPGGTNRDRTLALNASGDRSNSRDGIDPRFTSNAPLSTQREMETQMPGSTDPDGATQEINGARPGEHTGAGGDAMGAGRANGQDPMHVGQNASDIGVGADPSKTGSSAAGVGRASNGTGDPANGGRVTSAGAAQAAPWDLDTWSTHREAALERIAQGRIPDAYQSLVREYFSR